MSPENEQPSEPPNSAAPRVFGRGGETHFQEVLHSTLRPFRFRVRRDRKNFVIFVGESIRKPRERFHFV